MQPVRRYGVDAAILFSDIVVPLKAIGVDLDIKPGIGPVVAAPIRDAAALEVLRPIEPEDVSYVTEAVQALTKELGATPLIGFAGAPFTLASYLIEGGPSKNHDHTKAMMYGEPELWHAMMDRLTDDHPRVPARPARSRSLGRPALRLLGRRRVARRLPGVRPPLHPPYLRGPGRPGRPAHPLRRRHRRAARPARRGRGRCGRHRLAGPARRGRPAGRPRQGAAGQHGPDDPVRPLGGRRDAARATSSPARPRPRATSSTSATACCPAPTPTSSPVSRISCTRPQPADSPPPGPLSCTSLSPLTAPSRPASGPEGSPRSPRGGHL